MRRSRKDTRFCRIRNAAESVHKPNGVRKGAFLRFVLGSRMRGIVKLQGNTLWASK